MAVPLIIARFIASAVLNDFRKNGTNGWAGSIVSKLTKALPSQKGGGAQANKTMTNRGTQGWDDRDIGYLPSKGERALTYGLPVLGDVLNVVGQGLGTYQSVLGAALTAAAKPQGYRSGAIDAPEAGLAMLGAGHISKGTIYSMLGKALSNRLTQSANQLRQENQLARQEALISNTNGMSTAISRLNANPVGSNNNKGATPF